MTMLRSFGAIAFACLCLDQSLAADMPMPPPIPEAPRTAESHTDWYLRGDIAYIFPKMKFDAPGQVPFVTNGLVAGPNSNPATWIWDESNTWLANKKTHNGWGIGGGIGKDFGMFRIDVTADYMFPVKDTADRVGKNFLYPDYRMEWDAHGHGKETAERERLTLLLNAYLDLGNWEGLTPYLGAGFGAAWSRWKLSSEQTCIGDHSECQPDYQIRGNEETGPALRWQRRGQDWSPAVALMAGASYDLGHNWALDFGWRGLYVDDGDKAGEYNYRRREGRYLHQPRTDPITLGNAFTQEVRFGVRKTFGGPDETANETNLDE